MKKIFCICITVCASFMCVAQNGKMHFISDSVSIDSKIEFFTYNGPYGTENNVSKPAIKFIVTVKNNGTQPVPDLAVSNRSEYLNFFVNGKNENPVSMYNGAQANGNHMLGKGQSDSYTWWIFTEDAYADSFTVKWEYCGKASKEIVVDLKK